MLQGSRKNSVLNSSGIIDSELKNPPAWLIFIAVSITVIIIVLIGLQVLSEVQKIQLCSYCSKCNFSCNFTGDLSGSCAGSEEFCSNYTLNVI